MIRAGIFFNDESGVIDWLEMPIIILLPTGFISKANGKLCEMLGYTNDEIQCLHWKELIPKDFQFAESKRFIIANKKGVSEVQESVLVDKHGGLHFVQGKHISIRNQNDELTGIVYSCHDVSQLVTLKEQLFFQEQQAKKKLWRIIQKVETRERRDIALELHDNVNQILTSCMLLLENNSMNELILKNCRKHLQYAIDEVRNISHRLSSDEIQKQGFKQCLEQIIKTINDSEALVIHFEMDSDVDIDILDSTLLNNLLRVFQEHLNNIIKHADASNVSISIAISLNSLEVEIKDNGRGFDICDIALGQGLQDIYERVELFGGKAIFDTSPGHGCILSLCIPVLHSIEKTE